MQPPRSQLAVLSVVPSPYQRDVFEAIAARRRVDLRVYYLERAAPDSPWPDARLAPWESVLGGFTLGNGRWRSHVNWGLPRPAPRQYWIVNGAMTDVSTQHFMRVLGRRFPWCFWGELPSQRTGWRGRLQALQYRPLQYARAIVAVGRRAADAYARMLPGVPVHNQPYLCRLDAFASAAEGRTDNPETVFLFCGQMIERKGIDILLNAFSTLVQEGLPVRLQLVGREADLPRHLSALPASTRERISYAGFQAPEQLPTWFSRADVFVLPSRHDGWGVVVNQALGAGLPVICSDAVGAAVDLVEEGRNGLLVRAGDVDHLAGAMRQLASSPELRRSYRAEAQRTARNLSPEIAAAFWENLAFPSIT